MATLIISYPRQEGARFDADYYRDKHMPLVESIWGPLGMTSGQVLWPADDEQINVAVTIASFKDSAAIDAIMTSPESAKVFGDVPHFTDIQATVYRSD